MSINFDKSNPLWAGLGLFVSRDQGWKSSFVLIQFGDNFSTQPNSFARTDDSTLAFVLEVLTLEIGRQIERESSRLGRGRHKRNLHV